MCVCDFDVADGRSKQSWMFYVVSVAASDDDGATSHLDVQLSKSCNVGAKSYDCKPPAWASQLRVT